jgi:hypothetical protein
MVTKTTTTETCTFIDKHGVPFGFCALTLTERIEGDFYATIVAEMPKYSEHTTWSDIGEARYQFDKDVEYYESIYAEV